MPTIIGNCTEGNVTVSTEADGSSLQLVEMCDSEGVWSPLCDNDWTPQDATVVCRELGYAGYSIAVCQSLLPSISMVYLVCMITLFS